MRLAWFTPWPPQRSGIAGRSHEVVHALAARGHGIDVFVDERLVPVTRANDEAPRAGEVRVQSAHDFVWRQTRGQYELAVYQMGNSRLHEFIWPYAYRWPGLVVLHDARLHHARGRALLKQRRPEAYRAEFAWNHPEVSRDAAELGVLGFDGTYYYQWPMLRGLVETSRLLATHTRGGVSDLREEFPETAIEYIALGEGRAAPTSEAERAATRRRLGIAPETVLFGTFGALTAEKRIPQILRAFAAVRARIPLARLLLAGTPDAHLDLGTQVASLGLTEIVQFAQTPDDEKFDDFIAAADVSLNLRWPSAVETSGPWLRALSTSRPTVVLDLPHQAHLSAYDPQSWTTRAAYPPSDPMCVALDVLDEEHSLRLTLSRLYADVALRSQIGHAGRRYWERAHTITSMLDDYDRVMTAAGARPVVRGPSPDGVRPDPLAYLESVSGPVLRDLCESR